MKSLTFRCARFRSGFRFASMQIPEKNAEIRSHKELTAIFGFSNATFAPHQLIELCVGVRDQLPGFCGKAVKLPHRIHGEAAALIKRAARGFFKKPFDISPTPRGSAMSTAPPYGCRDNVSSKPGKSASFAFELGV